MGEAGAGVGSRMVGVAGRRLEAMLGKGTQAAPEWQMLEAMVVPSGLCLSCGTGGGGGRGSSGLPTPISFRQRRKGRQANSNISGDHMIKRPFPRRRPLPPSLLGTMGGSGQGRL